MGREGGGEVGRCADGTWLLSGLIQCWVTVSEQGGREGGGEVGVRRCADGMWLLSGLIQCGVMVRIYPLCEASGVQRSNGSW